MTDVKFRPGQLMATPGALQAIEESGQTPDFFLDQHLAGNWGMVDREDGKLNDEALRDGGRILSAYRTLKGQKLWIISEVADDAGHRAATTILLPEECASCHDAG
jgi:hypothetical protein